MKLTKSELKYLIMEEAQSVLSELDPDGGDDRESFVKLAMKNIRLKASELYTGAWTEDKLFDLNEIEVRLHTLFGLEEQNN